MKKSIWLTLQSTHSKIQLSSWCSHRTAHNCGCRRKIIGTHTVGFICMLLYCASHTFRPVLVRCCFCWLIFFVLANKNKQRTVSPSVRWFSSCFVHVEGICIHRNQISVLQQTLWRLNYCRDWPTVFSWSWLDWVLALGLKKFFQN